MKVLAALVTSNRCQLLERCIKHLKLQTKEPYEILVVNNGSTDNTEFFLKKNNIKFINQNNLGSAGGWHTAIDYAIKNNFEYIWLMDDDGYPEKYVFIHTPEEYFAKFKIEPTVHFQSDFFNKPFNIQNKAIPNSCLFKVYG